MKNQLSFFVLPASIFVDPIYFFLPFVKTAVYSSQQFMNTEILKRLISNLTREPYVSHCHASTLYPGKYLELLCIKRKKIKYPIQFCYSQGSFQTLYGNMFCSSAKYLLSIYSVPRACRELKNRAVEKADMPLACRSYDSLRT